VPIGMTLLACAPSQTTARVACIGAKGRRIADGSGSEDPMVLTFEVDAGTESRVPLSVEKFAGATDIAWSSDGKKLAVAVFQRTANGRPAFDVGPTRLFVVDVSDGTVREIESAHSSRLRKLAWHPAADKIAILDDYDGVGVTDLAGNETWLSNDKRVGASERAFLLFADQGRRLIAASEARLRSWTFEMDQWTPREHAVGIAFKPTAATLTPDGGLMITGDEVGVLSFRQLPGLDVIATQEVDRTPVLELAVSPDVSRLSVLTQRGLTVLGAFVPRSPSTAARLTNWDLVDGRLVPLSSESREAGAMGNDALPAPFDAAAAEYWSILAQEDAFERRHMSVFQWMIGKRPVELSSRMREWLSENKDHPLATSVDSLALQ
jgi:hypothetical protein